MSVLFLFTIFSTDFILYFYVDSFIKLYREQALRKIFVYKQIITYQGQILNRLFAKKHQFSY